MKADNAPKLRSDRIWLTEEACDLEDFKAIVERSTNRADYPHASEVASNVLIYDLRRCVRPPPRRKHGRKFWPSWSRS